MDRPLKVATPLTAAFTSVPRMDPGPLRTDRVTVLLLDATIWLLESSTSIFRTGSEAPAVRFPGWVAGRSFVGVCTVGGAWTTIAPGRWSPVTRLASTTAPPVVYSAIDPVPVPSPSQTMNRSEPQSASSSGLGRRVISPALTSDPFNVYSFT